MVATVAEGGGVTAAVTAAATHFKAKSKGLLHVGLVVCDVPALLLALLLGTSLQPLHHVRVSSQKLSPSASSVRRLSN